LQTWRQVLSQVAGKLFQTPTLLAVYEFDRHMSGIAPND
jgi:hypothetical protein